MRFLPALKDRLTKWKEKEKFRPALPPYLIQKLREVKIEIGKYKSDKRQEFLSKIQETHDNTYQN